MTVRAKTKVSATGGTTYRISYRIKGSKTWKAVDTASQKKVIKGLKKGRIYQVRIRAYSISNGKKIYGPWSALKRTAKIK